MVLRCGRTFLPAFLSLEKNPVYYISILSYADALSSAQTISLAMRTSQLCMKYIQKFHNISHPNHSVLLSSSRGHTHDYSLRTKTTSNTKACNETCALIYYLQSSVQ